MVLLATPSWIEAGALFLVCWLLARVEIEIEGPRGWAEGLPTWRWGPPWFLRLTNGKPITGYHVYFTLLLLALFHLPLSWLGWSRALEAQALSRYLLVTCFWDFQWFLWNPAWGPRRFFGEKVWWFERRLLGLPVDYYAAVAGSGLAQALLWPQGLRRWAAVVAAMLVASAAALPLAALRGRGRS